MDVVVSFRKRWMIFLIGILLLLTFLFGVLPFAMGSIFPFNAQAPFALIFIPLFFYGLPVLWQAVHALLLHQPALIVSHTGIEVLPLNVPGRFFIRWSEIQCISVDRYFANTYLCIHPKESKAYLARFPRLTRFLAQIWAPRGLPLLSVPLLYLDQPSAEIFRQFSSGYASEVDSYQILLQP